MHSANNVISNNCVAKCKRKSTLLKLVIKVDWKICFYFNAAASMLVKIVVSLNPTATEGSRIKTR